MDHNARVFICLALLLTACDDTVNLKPQCGNFNDKCYAVWTEYYQDPQIEYEFLAANYYKLARDGLVGTCKMGTPTCDADYNVIDCQGAIYPAQSDECNNIDEDCDGKTDEDWYPTKSRLWHEEEPNPCISKVGVCGAGIIECVNGTFTCNMPDEWIEGPEKAEHCDGFDNDCNGRIDDIELECTDLLGNPVSCSCYEGPINTSYVGECRLGFYKCYDGNIECFDQVLPAIEICNNKDDNCNGIIDDTETILNSKYDVVFVLDYSGSMCPWHQAIAVALFEYLDLFEGNSNFRFAVVTISTLAKDQVYDGNPTLVYLQKDFTNLTEVRDFIANLGCEGSGSEASLDSMQMVCDIDNPLELSWITDAQRLMFVFTDEEGHTYVDPPTTSQDIIDACLFTKTSPFIWYHDLNSVEYKNITDNTNGLGFTLKKGKYPQEYWEPIFNDLNSVVIKICGT